MEISAIWGRKPPSETKICNWTEFFVLYKDNISCDMRRYPKYKVKFHIWSKILRRYRVIQKRNVRFNAIFYWKISDFNRIWSAIWFKFFPRSQLKNLLSEAKFYNCNAFLWRYEDKFVCDRKQMPQISYLNILFCPMWSQISYLKQNFRFELNL